MAKSIVKSNWLAIRSLSNAERARLEALLLEGLVHEAVDIPVDIFCKLSQAERAHVLAKAAQILGSPAKITKLLEDLAPAADELAHESLFLKGFALSRLGRESEASVCFKSLPARFQPRIEIERALIRANRGDFAGADALFTGVLDQHREGLDPYSLSTLLGGLALVLIQQGEFRRAEKCLAERKTLLKAHPSPVLSFGSRLYEILLALETNDFESAARLLGRSLTEQNKESVNGFFLLHLKLRLHLARNELTEAGAVLVDLKAITVALGFPEGVLDFRIEEIEWNLRSGRPGLAQGEIEKLSRSAGERKDEYFLFRLSLLKAQALKQKGEAGAAMTEIGSAIDKGEAKLYRPGLVWAFFHAAGIALAAGHAVQARLYLNRGRRLAGDLGLQARQACFSYMSEVLEKRHASASALIGLAKYQEIGPELEYFLDTYELLESVSLSVSDGPSQETIAEPQLRRRLFKNPGIFWFQKEAVLLANLDGSRVVSIELAKDSPLLTCFRLLWSALQQGEAGLTLKDIHKTRSPHVFQEELHAAAAKMLVSRLRDAIRGSRLEVKFDRPSGRYSLVAALPAFTIQSAAGGTEPAGKKDRESELLERIAMEPFVATKTLCLEFGVTRQALHPALSALGKRGRVRMVKRGPVSGYVYRS